MEKNFEQWNKRKTWIDGVKPRVFFHERDIWWSAMGFNIGFEQDGKGGKFSRPVLIFKKFNNEVFWALPFTTKEKSGKFYANVNMPGEGKQAVILSQLRLMDAKRLLSKIGSLSKDEYLTIQKAITNICES